MDGSVREKGDRKDARGVANRLGLHRALCGFAADRARRPPFRAFDCSGTPSVARRGAPVSPASPESPVRIVAALLPKRGVRSPPRPTGPRAGRASLVLAFAAIDALHSGLARRPTGAFCSPFSVLRSLGWQRHPSFFVPLRVSPAGQTFHTFPPPCPSRACRAFCSRGRFGASRLHAPFSVLRSPGRVSAPWPSFSVFLCASLCASPCSKTAEIFSFPSGQYWNAKNRFAGWGRYGTMEGNFKVH